MIYDELIRTLERALAAAKMEAASFDDMGGSTLVRYDPTTLQARTIGVKETEYIKERTRLYRESWVVHPIQSVLAQLKLNKALLDGSNRLVKALREGGLEELNEVNRAGLGESR